MNDDYLTVTQVAALAGMHPASVRRIIMRGELASVRWGPRVRLVPRAAVEAAIADGTLGRKVGRPKEKDDVLHS